MLGVLLHLARAAAHHAATADTRSPLWKTVRRHFLRQHPACAVCGTRVLLEAHHCIPFEHDPERELDEDNLIALCHWRGHHLAVGHGGNFRFYVTRVRELARQVRTGTKTAREAAELAKEERVPIRTGA